MTFSHASLNLDKTMRKIINLLVILISITPISVFSATIRADSDRKMIVLEGEIIEGDFEKILNIILENGVSYDTVFLASNGGNAREAMKIGRLISKVDPIVQTNNALV